MNVIIAHTNTAVNLVKSIASVLKQSFDVFMFPFSSSDVPVNISQGSWVSSCRLFIWVGPLLNEDKDFSVLKNFAKKNEDQFLWINDRFDNNNWVKHRFMHDLTSALDTENFVNFLAENLNVKLPRAHLTSMPILEASKVAYLKFSSGMRLQLFWHQLSKIGTAADQMISPAVRVEQGNEIIHFYRNTNFMGSATEGLIINCLQLTDKIISDTFDEVKYTQSLNSNQRFGTTILFSESVYSTQTFLEQRYNLVPLWPAGLIFIASKQLTGRGRGQNKWISPGGSILFSLVTDWGSSIQSLVFVQYIMALAVVEELKQFIPNLPVFIKWPNDVFIVPAKNQYHKIAGILVNSSFHDGRARLIVGCGINWENEFPPSVKSISGNFVLTESFPAKEEFLARILYRFEKLHVEIEEGNLTSFFDRYYQHWLHQDQEVYISGEVANISEQNGEQNDTFIQAKIVGLTEAGFLKALTTADGRHIELQPGTDSNVNLRVKFI